MIICVSYILMVNNLAALRTKWIHYRFRLIPRTNMNVFTPTNFSSTLGRPPLYEGSARRRNIYLKTHNNHKRQTSLPRRHSNPQSWPSTRKQTHTLDRAATEIGKVFNQFLSLNTFTAKKILEVYCACYAVGHFPSNCPLIHLLDIRFSSSASGPTHMLTALENVIWIDFTYSSLIVSQIIIDFHGRLTATLWVVKIKFYGRHKFWLQAQIWENMLHDNHDLYPRRPTDLEGKT
jgi:hypothetical protein